MKSLFLSAKIYSATVGILLVLAGMDLKAQQVITTSDMDADIVPRLSMDEAAFGITNQDNSVDLLLTHDAIVFQFTEDYLKRVADEIEGTDKIQANATFVQIFREVISKSVHTLLDRAIAIPLKEIKQITFENGRIVIINNDDEELFDKFEINDKQVMEDFSRRDARRFVAEAEKQMI